MLEMLIDSQKKSVRSGLFFKQIVIKVRLKFLITHQDAQYTKYLYFVFLLMLLAFLPIQDALLFLKKKKYVR